MPDNNTPDKNKKDDVGEELYDIARALSELVLREHQILQEEMTQMTSLVEDAVKRLDDDFRQLNAVTIEHSVKVDEALAEGLMDASMHKTLSRVGDQINQRVSSTVRALQFDDIVQQLSSHSRERIFQMQALFVELTKNLDDSKQGTSKDDATHLLHIRNMKEEINRFRIRLEKENPVKQHSMQAGKIELF